MLGVLNCFSINMFAVIFGCILDWILWKLIFLKEMAKKSLDVSAFVPLICNARIENFFKFSDVCRMHFLAEATLRILSGYFPAVPEFHCRGNYGSTWT